MLEQTAWVNGKFNFGHQDGLVIVWFEQYLVLIAFIRSCM